MKVGDLVRVKNTNWEVYGIILEINGRFKWAEVFWSNGHTYAFFAEDLEVINEDRRFSYSKEVRIRRLWHYNRNVYQRQRTRAAQVLECLFSIIRI